MASITAALKTGSANDQLTPPTSLARWNQQINDAFEFVRKNMRIGRGQKKSAGRPNRNNDLGAVFEAIVNAVAHRDLLA